MSFSLMSLPFAKDALAPYLSAETIDYHYGKHHNTYVVKLNQLLQGTPQEKSSSNADLESVVKSSTGAVFNNAAQIWNHNFYWNCIRPGQKDNAPTCPKLTSAINEAFGGFDQFKKSFVENCTGHFGSGWVWLVRDNAGKLKITQTHDADLPLKNGSGKALLVCDVWEHAYYIDYRNDRGTYVNNWFNLVNWDFVAKNFSE